MAKLHTQEGCHGYEQLCDKCRKEKTETEIFLYGDKRTEAQKERQKKEYRENGKYAKVNPCYVCEKSAGVDYMSHHDTDGLIDDELLVLCKRCAKKLSKYDGKTAIKIAFPDREDN